MSGRKKKSDFSANICDVRVVALSRTTENIKRRRRVFALAISEGLKQQNTTKRAADSYSGRAEWSRRVAARCRRQHQESTSRTRLICSFPLAQCTKISAPPAQRTTSVKLIKTKRHRNRKRPNQNQKKN